MTLFVKKEYKDAHIKNMGLLRRYFWLDSHGMLFRNGTFNIFVVLSFIVIVVIASSCAHTLYEDGDDVVTTESDITDLSENEDTYNMFYDKRRD